MPSLRDKYKNVGIIYNPISGGGLARVLTTSLATAMNSEGITVVQRKSMPAYESAQIKKWLTPLDIVFVSGGDGTLRGLLPSLADAQTPWYMLPAGHESLAARYLGMSSDPKEILTHLVDREPTAHYFGLLDQEPFFSMASIGFDSWVLNAIGQRTGPSSNTMYIKNICASILKYRGTTLDFFLDEKERHSISTGYIMIANSPAYARGVQFCPAASSRSKVFHATWQSHVRLPTTLRVLLALAFRKSSLLPSFELSTVKNVRLDLQNSYPVQCDGDPVEVNHNNPCFVKKHDTPVLALSLKTA